MLRRGLRPPQDIPLSGQPQRHEARGDTDHQRAAHDGCVRREDRRAVLRRDHALLRLRQARRAAQARLLEGRQALQPADCARSAGERRRLPAGLCHPRGLEVRGAHDAASGDGLRGEVPAGGLCGGGRLGDDERGQPVGPGGEGLQVHRWGEDEEHARGDQRVDPVAGEATGCRQGAGPGQGQAQEAAGRLFGRAGGLGREEQGEGRGQAQEEVHHGCRNEVEDNPAGLQQVPKGDGRRQNHGRGGRGHGGRRREVGRAEGLCQQCRTHAVRDCRSLPPALQRGAVVQDLKVQAGDTPDIPLQRGQDQGSHQHLLRCPEGLSGIGQDAEKQQDKVERRHGAEHRQNHPDNQCENGRRHLDKDPFPHQTAPTHRTPF